MLRMGVMADGGPIAIFGITEENLIRLRAGMPLELDIKELTPPNTRINKAYIHYAESHSAVLDDMREGGFKVSDEMYKQAQDLDTQLKRERRERGRK